MPNAHGGRDDAADAAGAADARHRLGPAVSELYADLRPDAVLEGLIRHSAAATGSRSGAVSMIDTGAERYTKAAEHGVACLLGRSFPLDEGVTGRAYALRRPVVLRDYGQVRGGHLPAHGAAGHRSVLAVPAWWRDEVIAVNVVFRPPGVGFSAGEVDDVEALTQASAPAIRLQAPADRSLGAVLRRRSGGRPVRIIETGTPPAGDATAVAASDIVAALDGMGGDGAARAALRIALVYRPDGARLLVHRETTGRAHDVADVLARLRDVVGRRAAALRVEDVPGWGLAVHADLLAAPPADPFTERERAVLALMKHGLTDHGIAAELGRSPKTVEKHVGAVLRKTGAPNRTAAVVAAIERGWL